MFTDSHCHLEDSYCDDIEKIIANAMDNKINRMITNASDIDSNNEVLKLISRFDNVYGTLGIHPNEWESYSDEFEKILVDNIKNPKIVAIGEIGLDYYYDKKYIEEQKKVFRKQLQIAEENNLPVVIHSREATKDTIDILKKYNVKGVIHSFSGSYETAMEYIKLGFILGINGVVTFKNSNLKEVIDKLSLEYIILETDSPYLTPEPFRGAKNEPKNIIEIAKFITNLKNISLEELSKITNKNIKRIFDI